MMNECRSALHPSHFWETTAKSHSDEPGTYGTKRFRSGRQTGHPLGVAHNLPPAFPWFAGGFCLKFWCERIQNHFNEKLVLGICLKETFYVVKTHSIKDESM